MTVGPWPDAFDAKHVAVTGGTQYVRLGGKGSAVLLLHGFGDTGDMWVPLADALVKDHAVIVPDLRGMGLSSHPEGGYEKVAQARDLATILDQLGFQEIALVTHDIGNMVGYAFAALFPQRVSRWVVTGRATAGDRPLGPPVETPEGLALQLPWPRRRAAGSGTRANLARPLLQRAFSQPVAHRRADTRTLCRALCASPRNPQCLQWTVCGLRARRYRQSTACRKGQTEDAGASNRRRSFLRRTSRHRNRFRRCRCARCRDQGLRSLDHGGATGAGSGHHSVVPQHQMILGIGAARRDLISSSRKCRRLAHRVVSQQRWDVGRSRTETDIGLDFMSTRPSSPGRANVNSSPARIMTCCS
jgi:pimeloyl-ACP methyl ester carboxylesterase